MDATRFTCGLGFLAAVLLAASPLPAATANHPSARASSLTAELIADLEMVDEIRLSPDGRNVAYLVRKHGTDSRTVRELWLATTEGELSQQRLLADHTAPAEPRWSPDGSQLALFATPQGGTHKLISLNPTSGAVTILSDFVGGDLKWSPDGRGLSFVAREPRLAKKPAAGAPKLLSASREASGAQVWLLDLATRQRRAVTAPDVSVGDYAWSPTGDAIVASHIPLDSVLSPLDTVSVFTFADGSHGRGLFNAHDQTISLSWSPDPRRGRQQKSLPAAWFEMHLAADRFGAR
jgi:Tol biopolymer transport system component